MCFIFHNWYISQKKNIGRLESIFEVVLFAFDVIMSAARSPWTRCFICGIFWFCLVDFFTYYFASPGEHNNALFTSVHVAFYCILFSFVSFVSYCLFVGLFLCCCCVSFFTFQFYVVAIAAIACSLVDHRWSVCTGRNDLNGRSGGDTQTPPSPYCPASGRLHTHGVKSSHTHTHTHTHTTHTSHTHTHTMLYLWLQRRHTMKPIMTAFYYVGQNIRIHTQTFTYIYIYTGCHLL